MDQLIKFYFAFALVILHMNIFTQRKRNSAAIQIQQESLQQSMASVMNKIAAKMKQKLHFKRWQKNDTISDIIGQTVQKGKTPQSKNNGYF